MTEPTCHFGYGLVCQKHALDGVHISTSTFFEEDTCQFRIALGLSGLVAEMIQATGDIGPQWILDLCNGIVKEGSIPEDWKSSVVLPIYIAKGDPMECVSYTGIKLLEHAMKVIERIFEHRIRQQIEIDDMQCGFKKGKGTTDAIFMAR